MSSSRFLCSITDAMATEDYGPLGGKVALGKVQATQTLATRPCKKSLDAP